MKHIASLINFSTNEASFLQACIEQAALFSDQIIISVCDHFFDGEQENKQLLNQIYAQFPECRFIQYELPPSYQSHSASFLHNLGRMLGSHFVHSEIEFLLFLDVDEIVEGKKIGDWMHIFPLHDYAALYFAGYWYFRDVCFQSKVWEDTSLLVKKKDLTYDLIMQPYERGGTFFEMPGKKLRLINGKEGVPMVHHYSWVRNKEQMLRKVRCWGHRNDRDWASLVEKEFSAAFQGKDFVHGYEFIQVEPFVHLEKEIFIEKKNGIFGMCIFFQPAMWKKSN